MFEKGAIETMKKSFAVSIGLGIMLCACSPKVQEQQLSSIQIHDRNGFQETISSPDRLNLYATTDFTEPQVYDKVVRTYKRSADGKTKLVLTSYHENGLLKQYLEGENGRARGIFREFYEDGKLKVEVFVIEGIAEFLPEAMQKWVFDGTSKAWDPNGALCAEITYEKGKLKGEAFYYHPNGEMKKVVPYLQGVIHGTVKEYDTYGNLIAEINYQLGEKHGTVSFLGTEEIPSYREEYAKGKLVSGEYMDPEGNIVSRVIDGKGTQVFYEKGVLRKKITIIGGEQEGEMWLYNDQGILSSTFSIKRGEKHGLETLYYENETPKLAMHWHSGEVVGQVKTWYENGVVQSESEMHGNAKHGMSVAWYEDGSLMLVEEYEKGKLVSGKYFKKGEEMPISKIAKGEGIAYLYDQSGVLLEKVMYKDGVPSEE